MLSWKVEECLCAKCDKSLNQHEKTHLSSPIKQTDCARNEA